MKIVMTGGGSGGHITPILAVAHELKQLDSDIQLIYIGQRGDGFGSLVAEQAIMNESYSVRAGKFRRYHGEGWRQFLDIETMRLNIRDGFLALAGLWQSFWLLRRLKPAVVFTRGGFVSVPVALAAALLRIPYVTHDSDAIPSLANRIIARWATLHAVALPVDLYPYPAPKTVNVGVPVAHEYQPVTAELRAAYRRATGLDTFQQIILVTGGGLGAERLNAAMLAVAADMLQTFPHLCIVHSAGRVHEASVSRQYSELLAPEVRPRVIVRDYIQNLYQYSGAANIIVARGGATNFAEFALQAKPCIIVPNPLLTGGHQVKNAAAYADKGAIVQLDEETLKANPQLLGNELHSLLQNPERQVALARAIHGFARPRSAEELADLLMGIATKDKSHS